MYRILIIYLAKQKTIAAAYLIDIESMFRIDMQVVNKIPDWTGGYRFGLWRSRMKPLERLIPQGGLSVSYHVLK
jgi:hypothetical protein